MSRIWKWVAFASLILLVFSAALVGVSGSVLPDPEIAARYEDRYARFRTLYPALKDVFRGVRA